MSLWRTPTIDDRRPGPSPFAAEDGLRSLGCYSGTLVSIPSAGTVKVLVPSLDLDHYYTASCSPAYAGAVGDPVLVIFDDVKHPWIVSPSALATITKAQVIATGVMATDIGGVASTDSRLSDARTPTAHASTHASGGSDPLTPTAIGGLARASNLSDVVSISTARQNLGIVGGRSTFNGNGTATVNFTIAHGLGRVPVSYDAILAGSGFVIETAAPDITNLNVRAVAPSGTWASGVAVAYGWFAFG